MKQILIIVMVFALLVSLPSAGGAEGAALTNGNYEFRTTAQGAAVITRYLGTETEIEIPGTLDGLAVIQIGEEAFRDSPQITAVLIPEGVEKIRPLAFYSCGSLRNVALPTSLLEIGDLAFAYCASLEEVVIPEGVSRIGEFAFGDCPELSSITIPRSVAFIGPEAFWGMDPGDASGIYGQEGSFAQEYARLNGIRFFLVETALTNTEPVGTIVEDRLKSSGTDTPDSTADAAFLNGWWIARITYERYHYEDGIEKEWNVTWRVPVELRISPDGGGTWIEHYSMGSMEGNASYAAGSIQVSLHRNGPVEYTGAIENNENTYTMSGSITEENHSDRSWWAAGTWTATRFAQDADLKEYRALNIGTNGDDVLALKQRMYELKYFKMNPQKASKTFTKETAEFVREFEEINGLPPDGVADPLMQALFFSNCALPRQATDP